MKIKRYLNSSFIIFIAISITACAGRTTRWEYEDYTPPKNGPKATLINMLNPALLAKDAASVSMNIDDCAQIIKNNTAEHSVYRNMTLLSMKANDLQKFKEVEVPAEKQISLSYSSTSEYSSKKTYCNVIFLTSLEKDKKYILVGGYQIIKSDALLVPNKSGCALGIIDAETMLPLKKIDKPLCTTN